MLAVHFTVWMLPLWPKVYSIDPIPNLLLKDLRKRPLFYPWRCGRTPRPYPDALHHSLTLARLRTTFYPHGLEMICRFRLGRDRKQQWPSEPGPTNTKNGWMDGVSS